MRRGKNTALKRHTGISWQSLLKMNTKSAQIAFNKLPVEKKAAIVLAAPWQERQKLFLILDDPKALIQAIPEEEIYWTIKSIGESDALSIISMTSFEQFQYIIDIDCWEKDRIKSDKIILWLGYLSRCSEVKILEWLYKTDEYFLVFSFKNLMKVFKIDEDMDGTEAENLPSFTLDGTYYIEFFTDDTRQIATRILPILFYKNNKMYSSLLEAVIWDSAIEIEEDALHWRQSRISEKGFPDLEEALEVYQYVKPEEINHFMSMPRISTVDSDKMKPGLSIRYLLKTDKPSLLIQKILPYIASMQIAERLQKEIVHVSNKIIMADCLQVQDMRDMQRALRKAMGYANIAVELLSDKKFEKAAEILESVPFIFLFRLGYTQVLHLKKRLNNNKRKVWIQNRGLQSQFFDTPWGEAICGLEQTRPLFFKGLCGKSNEMGYREFEQLSDVVETGRVIDIVLFIEKFLFDLLCINPEWLFGDFIGETTLDDRRDIKAKCVFLTLIANHLLKGQTKLEPLTQQEMIQFLRLVFVQNKMDDLKPYRLKTGIYQDSVSWISRQYCIRGEEKQLLKHFLQTTFDFLDEECSNLADKEKIDSRYVNTLLIKKIS